LSANITLASNNKTLEEQNEQLKVENYLFRKICLVIENKEVDANNRVDDLGKELAE